MPGITNCVPLRSTIDQKKHYGAYCLDEFPTAEDSAFVRKYYSTKDGSIVNYLIFNRECSAEDACEDVATQFGPGEPVRKWTEALVFSNVLNQTDGSRSNYTIDSVVLERKRVDQLNEYMELFRDQYNLDKVAKLPAALIQIGTFTVTQ